MVIKLSQDTINGIAEYILNTYKLSINTQICIQYIKEKLSGLIHPNSFDDLENNDIDPHDIILLSHSKTNNYNIHITPEDNIDLYENKYIILEDLNRNTDYKIIKSECFHFKNDIKRNVSCIAIHIQYSDNIDMCLLIFSKKNLKFAFNYKNRYTFK